MRDGGGGMFLSEPLFFQMACKSWEGDWMYISGVYRLCLDISRRGLVWSARFMRCKYVFLLPSHCILPPVSCCWLVMCACAMRECAHIMWMASLLENVRATIKNWELSARNDRSQQPVKHTHKNTHEIIPCYCIKCKKGAKNKLPVCNYLNAALSHDLCL